MASDVRSSVSNRATRDGEFAGVVAERIEAVQALGQSRKLSAKGVKKLLRETIRMARRRSTSR
jgi:hypothetical protein